MNSILTYTLNLFIERLNADIVDTLIAVLHLDIRAILCTYYYRCDRDVTIDSFMNKVFILFGSGSPTTSVCINNEHIDYSVRDIRNIVSKKMGIDIKINKVQKLCKASYWPTHLTLVTNVDVALWVCTMHIPICIEVIYLLLHLLNEVTEGGIFTSS